MLLRLGLVPLFVALAVLIWNVTLAGWIATRRDRDVWFSSLTGLAGLLVAPAAVLAVASSTDAGARTITGVAWLWPATCLLLVLQASIATIRRQVSSSVGVPIVLYNAVIACIAIADDMVARSGTAPQWLQGAVAARDSVLGMIMGRAALASPLALMVPLIAPAYPARWRSSALVRAVLVLYAAVTVTLMVMEWPRGVAAVRSYEAASRNITPREPASLALGIRFLPVVRGLPTARDVRVATNLAGELAPDALLVVVRARAVRASGLDSLVRVLAPYRSDSLRILVAIAWERDDALSARSQPDALSALRLDVIERVVERVRPYAVLPALAPMLPTERFVPSPSAAWWQEHFASVAVRVKRIRPATHVMWMASRFDAADSAMYAWAIADGSPISLVGLAPTPGFSGLPPLDARLRAVDRWVTAADRVSRPHWVIAAGLPRAHGDAAQADAVRHVISWASRRQWVRGVIVGEPTDDGAMLGMTSASGRDRQVVETVRRAVPRDSEGTP